MTAWTDTEVITTVHPRPGAIAVDIEADADAVEELFKRLYPKLAGWARRLVDDDETAHELASEAFVRLLSRPLSTVDSPQRYLYTTAGNLIRDHWRETRAERRALNSVTCGRQPSR